MATIADELNSISVEHGYTGAAPKTIAGAIDALADTLAGTDVEGKRTIAGAVKALAPYIGGGGSLGEIVGVNTDGTKATGIIIGVSTTPFDITSGETSSDVQGSIIDNVNVFITNGTFANSPSGCYIVVQATVSSGWTTDSLTVYDGSRSGQITSGFDCRVLDGSVFFTMQIPADGLVVDFGN